jgi:hypothetical protein
MASHSKKRSPTQTNAKPAHLRLSNRLLRHRGHHIAPAGPALPVILHAGLHVFKVTEDLVVAVEGACAVAVVGAVAALGARGGAGGRRLPVAGDKPDGLVGRSVGCLDGLDGARSVIVRAAPAGYDWIPMNDPCTTNLPPVPQRLHRVRLAPPLLQPPREQLPGGRRAAGVGAVELVALGRRGPVRAAAAAGRADLRGTQWCKPHVRR